MRILQVVHSFPPYNYAGTEVYTFNLSLELSRRHEVFVIHRINDPSRDEWDIRFRWHRRIGIFEINNTFRQCESFRMLYQNPFISKRFSDILTKIRPDIVHIQHLLFLSTDIIEQFNNNGIPVIFTLHDYWLFCPQGQLFNRSYKICSGPDLESCYKCQRYLLSIRKNIMRYYQGFRRYMPLPLLSLLKNIYFFAAHLTFLKEDTGKSLIRQRIEHIKEMLEKVDKFISPSSFLRNRFIDFGIEPEKIMILPYGFRHDFFTHTHKKDTKKITIVFIGTLIPAKGADLLIRAFNRLNHPNIELRIYGRLFPYKGFEHYTNLLIKLGRGKKIRFMGEFNNADMDNIFRQANVLVVPSLWPENSPLVIQEAHAAGIPVIASRIGGIPELITHRKNGLLFKAGDSEDLHCQLKSFIEEAGLPQYLQSNITPPMTIEENARKIEKIYLDLLRKIPHREISVNTEKTLTGG